MSPEFMSSVVNVNGAISVTISSCYCVQCTVAVDMDIPGYIHVWISDLDHAVDIFMDM